MSIATTSEPFDFQLGGNWPGQRGILFEATRPDAPGIALSVDFPSVWISDAGDVEFAEGYRIPTDDMLAWLEELATAIRAHNPVTP